MRPNIGVAEISANSVNHIGTNMHPWCGIHCIADDWTRYGLGHQGRCIMCRKRIPAIGATDNWGKRQTRVCEFLRERWPPPYHHRHHPLQRSFVDSLPHTILPPPDYRHHPIATVTRPTPDQHHRHPNTKSTKVSLCCGAPAPGAARVQREA